MYLLHLSDIHFRKGDILSKMDPDIHLRNELTQDIVARFKKIGEPPRAILISGDIAFAGDPAEYDFALSWLELLCNAVGVPVSIIFVCPGNHDVARKVSGSPAVQACHKDLKAATDLSLDAQMKGLLEEPTSGALLYKSIEAYNQFAVRFFCDLSPHTRTMVQRSLQFKDGSKLVMTGLNSTFISSEADKPNELLVDPSFRQLIRTPGEVNLVMCHHPFDWLRNGDVLKDHLNDVAPVQLFGHKHVERIERTTECVRVAAGSMQPERHKAGWSPGYNIIKLDIEGDGAQRRLNVDVTVLVLQEGPTKFNSKRTKEDKDVWSHSIPLAEWHCPDTSSPKIETTKLVTLEEKNDPMSSLRDISIRFFKLTLSQKSAIVGKLELLPDSSENQETFMLFKNALLLAQSKGLLEAVDSEIRNFEGK